MKKMNRKDILKSVMRGGVVVGLVGTGVALNRREERFECSDRCGQCPKNDHGNCALGLK